jgi:transcription elongation GreA/GreB family factor
MSEVIEVQIKAQLDKLADMHAHEDVIALRYDELREQILTPEILAQLEGLEAKMADELAPLQAQIKELEAKIRAAVVAHGKSVKGAHMQAIFNRRVSWDTKTLEGLMIVIPDIEKARKERVYTSLRKR